MPAQIRPGIKTVVKKVSFQAGIKIVRMQALTNPDTATAERKELVCPQ